jgi:hypothetical protein
MFCAFRLTRTKTGRNRIQHHNTQPKPTPWNRKANDTPKAGVSIAHGVKKPAEIGSGH